MTRSRDISALLGSTGTITASVLDSSVSEALGGGTDEYANPAALPATADVGDQAFVSSTNRLYIWTGAGWYNIALINQTPTWDSNGQPDGSYTLATDGSATTITLLATDPDGLVVSYTATADSAFDAIATVSDSDNVFTITPKFTIDDDSAATGSGSITFRATDGVNYASALSSFTINFIIAVENSKYTSALVTSVGSNGGTNSTVTDASTNGHTITVNGNASSQTFSPYRSGGYSYYFDGSGDYLTIDSTSAFGFDTSTDFTLEAWFYPTTTTGDRALFDLRPSSSANATFFIDASTGKLAIWNGTFYGGTGTVVSANEWHHIALVRSGSTTTAYLDGSVDFTTTVSLDFSTARPLGIGGAYYSPSSHFTGFISDLRILKGTAVYIADFTPPTKRLKAITNTSLLTCHLPYVKDGSTNDHSITVNGDVSAKPFGPYDCDEYDAATHGGSLYFDGNGDYLVTPSMFNVGTGNFTIELWFYGSDLNTVGRWVSARDTGGITLGHKLDQYEFFYGNGSLVYTGPNGVIKKDQWNHVALVRNSGTVTLYHNGKSQTISDWSSVNLSAVVHRIANSHDSRNEIINGYISDLRMSASAIYTAEFTSPTAPLSSVTSNFHLKGTDASIIDKSQSTQLTLVGNTQSSTTVTKYGSSSMYFDGNSDYIRIGNNKDILDGLINNNKLMTIEGWVYPTVSRAGSLIYESPSILNIGNTYLNLGLSNLTPFFYWWTGAQNSVTASNPITLNAWSHIAFVLDANTGSNNIKIYVNGTLDGQGTFSGITWASASDGDKVRVGIGNSNADSYFPGYIQDLRITDGLARYTANFTPPTALKG